MYKLYDYDVHSLMDKSEDEYDIINTMSTYFQAQIGTRFLIIYHNKQENMDEIYRVIKTVGQYYDYVKDYQKRKLESMSCMQLKKEILDMQDKPKRKRKCK